MLQPKRKYSRLAKLPCQQQGFTLVELVMVIILLAIVGTFSSKFIATNVTLFQQSVNQNERLNDARFVLNRIGKELNAAIAFSSRIQATTKGQCLRFIPFNAASQYLGLASGDQNIQLIMDSDSRKSQANIGAFENQRLSIFNKQYSEFQSAPVINDYQASGASTTHANLQLSSAVTNDSPAARYFIFNREISYCLKGNNLYRYDDAFPAVSPSANRVLMMDRLTTDSKMKLTSANQFSNAIVEFDLGFLLRDGQSIRFQHQAVLNNVP